MTKAMSSTHPGKREQWHTLTLCLHAHTCTHTIIYTHIEHITIPSLAGTMLSYIVQQPLVSGQGLDVPRCKSYIITQGREKKGEWKEKGGEEGGGGIQPWRRQWKRLLAAEEE